MKLLSLSELLRILGVLCIMCICLSQSQQVSLGLEASDENTKAHFKDLPLNRTAVELQVMDRAKDFKMSSDGSHNINTPGARNEMKSFSIKYKLYNKNIDSNGEVITYTSKKSDSKWIVGKKLVIIIHGWMQTAEVETNPDVDKAFATSMNIKEAYMASNRSENLILVNWEEGAGAVNFITVARRSYVVGKALGHMIVSLKLRKFIKGYSEVKIVGFSLGAHVAGVAGYFIFDKLETKIAEIIGLDAIGNYFDERKPLKIRLDKTDADFVQVVHCNMGKLYWPLFDPHFGTTVVSGHVDFYPNGGVDQPDCPQSIKAMANLCSHFRCSELYASTVRGVEFKGCECESPQDYLKEKCGTCEGPLMGDLCPKNATGTYYMKAIPLKEDKHPGL